MIIYHGSNVAVEKPKILPGERMLDFGVGFYTTENKEQAIRWTEKVAERRKNKDQIITVYKFDIEKAECQLNVIRFTEPCGEWLDFVCDCRRGRDPAKPYDIVFGPVADDQVYSVVQFYENGVYDKEYAIRRLKVDGLYNQILFHTEKSLEYCLFARYEKLGGAT